MHECRHCGDVREEVEDLHSHVRDHNLHWHHCELCGEDLMERLEDFSPSSHRVALDRIRKQHIAERSDAVHFG